MRCIAKTKNSKKCKKNAHFNNLCSQHYNICYKDFDKTNNVLLNNENINSIIDNKSKIVTNSIIETDENDNCSICLENDNYKYVTKTCCNYKLHYKCLETFLCMKSTELRCPVCKVSYNENNIKNIFTRYQVQILYSRMYQHIYFKSRKINKSNKEFLYFLQLINNCERHILVRTNQVNGDEIHKDAISNYKNSIIIYEQRLVNIYSESCKILKDIEIYLQKTNVIKKNYIKTVEIYDRNKYFINRMRTILINRGIM